MESIYFMINYLLAPLTHTQSPWKQQKEIKSDEATAKKKKKKKGCKVL